jgi:hypothetical protein
VFNQIKPGMSPRLLVAPMQSGASRIALPRDGNELLEEARAANDVSRSP